MARMPLSQQIDRARKHQRAAERRAQSRRRRPSSGDRMLGVHRTNTGRGGATPTNQPNAIPGTVLNPRAGKKFELGLTKDGRIVHIYSKRDVKHGPRRIVMGPPRKGLRPPVPGPVAPPVLGTHPAVQSQQEAASAFQRGLNEQAQRRRNLAARRRANRRSNRASGYGSAR